jgi:hypothetical protein
VFDLLQGEEQHYKKFKHAIINRGTALKAISDTFLGLNTQNFSACHNIRSKLVDLLKSTGTTFLMFSSINFTTKNLLRGILNKTRLKHRRLFVICGNFFDDRLINRELWSAITPLDYYLFPDFKNTIFKKPIHRIDDLKSRIKEECERVTPYTLVYVFENMKRRLTMFIEAQSYHFQHLLLSNF